LRCNAYVTCTWAGPNRIGHLLAVIPTYLTLFSRVILEVGIFLPAFTGKMNLYEGVNGG